MGPNHTYPWEPVSHGAVIAEGKPDVATAWALWFPTSRTWLSARVHRMAADDGPQNAPARAPPLDWQPALFQPSGFLEIGENGVPMLFTRCSVKGVLRCSDRRTAREDSACKCKPIIPMSAGWALSAVFILGACAAVLEKALYKHRQVFSQGGLDCRMHICPPGQ